jgi:hypothetical protein
MRPKCDSWWTTIEHWRPHDHSTQNGNVASKQLIVKRRRDQGYATVKVSIQLAAVELFCSKIRRSHIEVMMRMNAWIELQITRKENVDKYSQVQQQMSPRMDHFVVVADENFVTDLVCAKR